jgi:tetratricopeptide (TPR) repeat protein
MTKTTCLQFLVRTLFFISGIAALPPSLCAQEAAGAKESAPPPVIVTAATPSSEPVPPNRPTLASAILFYRSGNYDEASRDYNALISAGSNPSLANAGLARVLLKQEKLAEALTAANKAVALDPSNPLTHIALGEVYFRSGKILEAEAEFLPIVKSGEGYARAYLGEARVSWASSYYKQAKRLVEVAHNLDSADPDIRSFWIQTIFLEAKTKKAQEKIEEKDTIESDKREQGGKILETLSGTQMDRRSCRPVSKVDSLELPFEMLLNDPKTYRAVGLQVGINGASAVLMVDTGATGILVGRKVAEKAGVSRIAEMSTGGIGDRGEQSGYLGHVDSIRIGNLEFRDCYVRVIDRKTAIGDDGLLGADLFSDFLVDLDFSGRKFRLSALPPHPIEKSADPEHIGGLQDRYISPEMKGYTPIFRFGHNLLVSTRLNDSVTGLFLLDSGAMFTSISPTAARAVTKVGADSNTTVKGLSGNVKNVYRADQATLTFGHLRQKNQDIIGFDTTSMSESVGTEVSGMLGFSVLGMLDVKIDYRDGLVDFIFDQNKWCKGKCR